MNLLRTNSHLTLIGAAPLALLAVTWAFVFFRIHDTWIVNPVYAYGWSVPWLALYLARQRWLDRPEPSALPAPTAVWSVGLLLLAANASRRAGGDSSCDALYAGPARPERRPWS